MNLLPRSHAEFTDVEYWNKFFRKRGKDAFEWYGGYAELCDVLHKYVRPRDDILEIGCGNSDLAAQLHDSGYSRMTSIDISPVVVRQMQQKRPDVCYMQMDVLDMSFAADSFSVVLDKGTLDALMPSESEGGGAAAAQGARLFAEVARVLRVGGRFICFSLLQPHVARRLLSEFAARGWLCRVVRCHEANGGRMSVFAAVCTKAAGQPGRPLLELCLAGKAVQRVDSVAELLDAVKAAQQVALMCWNLQQRALDADADVSLDLLEPISGQRRYTVHIVERKRRRGGGAAAAASHPYAAFVVPLGRETEWLFGTSAGRRELAENAQCGRLAIVTMHTGQSYGSLDAIKDELAHAVRDFAPASSGSGGGGGGGATSQIPFLSVGEEDKTEYTGGRHVRFQGSSTASGDFVVEDWQHVDGRTHRRLVFLSNRNVVQSEARLRADASGSAVDPLYLACQHHVPMSVGAQAATAAAAGDAHILVVGLGGGALCTFLARCTAARVSAVDVDAAMRDVAEAWFGLECSARLQVHIADGLEFVRTAATAGHRYDAILLDVDSKDSSVGLSCPPAAFLEPAALQRMRTCLSADDGLLVLNLVARDATVRPWALRRLRDVFGALATYRVPGELNEVVFCGGGTPGALLVRLHTAASALNERVRRCQQPHRRKRRGQPAAPSPPPPPLLDIKQFKRALALASD